MGADPAPDRRRELNGNRRLRLPRQDGDIPRRAGRSAGVVMLSPTQVLANYGEVVATMIVVGALLDWTLDERQRDRLVAFARRIRDLAAALRRRLVLDRFAQSGVRSALLTSAFLAEALLVFGLARHLDYRGDWAGPRDILIGDMLLFAAPLGVAAAAFAAGGPRLVALLTGRGHLLACLGKCLAAAVTTDILAYGALRAMNVTYLTFGPRALLPWWDVRLWVYAVEYAASGMIVGAMLIAHLLLAVCIAAGLAAVVIAIAVLQAELVARAVARYPRIPLLGCSIVVAGLASVAKSWV
jgi:hypothetical protein